MTHIALLRKLGLSAHEADIYGALLEGGPGTVASIAFRAGVHRPAVYAAIPRLLQKGLVSQSQTGKRTVYIAEPPSAMKRLLSELHDELEEELPEMLSAYTQSRHKPIIHFYEGKKGIAAVYEDMALSCRKGDVIYRYESPKDYKKNKKYYPTLYMEKLGSKHSVVEKFVITNEKTHKARQAQMERYSKAVPAKYDLFDYDITHLIYKNKVAFIDYQSETASLIESASFARFQIKIFKLLFERL